MGLIVEKNNILAHARSSIMSTRTTTQKCEERTVPFHEDEGRLLGHDIVNDAFDTLLVLLQDLGADCALD